MELAVVIAVLMLATTAMVPSFLRFQRQEQLREAVRRTIALAGEARGLAIARDATVALTVDGAAKGLRLQVEPNEEDARAADAPAEDVPLTERATPDAARLLEYPVDVTVTVETPDGEPDPVLRFYGDGRADSARIRFERKGLPSLFLAVNPRTGRLRPVEEQP